MYLSANLCICRFLYILLSIQLHMFFHINVADYLIVLLSIYLYVWIYYLSIYLFIYSFIYLSKYVSICMYTTHISRCIVCLLVGLFKYINICIISIFSNIHVCFSLPVFTNICLCIILFIWTCLCFFRDSLYNFKKVNAVLCVWLCSSAHIFLFSYNIGITFFCPWHFSMIIKSETIVTSSRLSC